MDRLRRLRNRLHIPIHPAEADRAMPERRKIMRERVVNENLKPRVMEEKKDRPKSAGDAVKEKQSAIDKAANLAAEENKTSNAEDIRNRNRRDHSEKVSGKGSSS